MRFYPAQVRLDNNTLDFLNCAEITAVGYVLTPVTFSGEYLAQLPNPTLSVTRPCTLNVSTDYNTTVPLFVGMAVNVTVSISCQTEPSLGYISEGRDQTIGPN